MNFEGDKTRVVLHTRTCMKLCVRYFRALQPVEYVLVVFIVRAAPTRPFATKRTGSLVPWKQVMPGMAIIVRVQDEYEYSSTSCEQHDDSTADSTASFLGCRVLFKNINFKHIQSTCCVHGSFQTEGRQKPHLLQNRKLCYLPGSRRR